MSKIIIYDNKNILIAELDRTETIKKECYDEMAYSKEYAVFFKEHKIINSNSLRKQLKKIEQILKYHKDKKEVKNA